MGISLAFFCIFFLDPVLCYAMCIYFLHTSLLTSTDLYITLLNHVGLLQPLWCLNLNRNGFQLQSVQVFLKYSPLCLSTFAMHYRISIKITKVILHSFNSALPDLKKK